MVFPDASSRILVAHGAREAEDLLLGEVSRWVEQVRRNPSLLSAPLRILVPSRSLREHLAALLVRRLRPGLAGIRIQTLHSLAKEILEGAGKKVPGGAPLVELLIRRHGSEEPQLKEELGHLRDGMGAVVGSVVDFLEAGLQEAHLEALDELLCSKSQLPAAQRARAVLRVAGRTLQDMETLGVGIHSTSLVLARELLEERGEELLGEGPILVHGFSDLTGVGLDFMETLFRLRPCGLVLDHPPCPGKWDQPDPGKAFTGRLLRRLSPHAALREVVPQKPPSPELWLFHAPGPQAECRQVALLVQGLLRSGVGPENIGVVARRLEPYGAAIRSQFLQLGIPFSGISARGPKDRAWRSLAGLMELLQTRQQCGTELWLELMEPTQGGEAWSSPREELLLALRCLGAGRVKEVAGLELARIARRWPNGYPLPMRLGLEEEGQEEVVAPRRVIPLGELDRLQRHAIELQEALLSWMDGERDPSGHIQVLQELVSKILGWSDSHPAMSPLGLALEGIREDTPPGMFMTMEEFLLILGPQLEGSAGPRLGGKGGGVQVLEVMEARGRTFQHLFLVGMNRDMFPRPIQQDPILPDPVRRALLPLLEDLPVKEEGFEEERYLFAQLLSSSPRVIISWQSTDEEGKPMAVSPLVEKLRLEAGLKPFSVGSSLWQEPLFSPPGPSLRPPREHAVRAGLRAPRHNLEPLLSLAMEESQGQSPIWEPRAAARARVLVLEEMDPDLRTQEGQWRSSQPGPYMGLVGRMWEPADPRRGSLYVTTLESLALCPWQCFLGKLLRLEQPRDPLESLPELGPLQLGKLVHAILEVLVRGHLGPSGVAELCGVPQEGKVTQVPWPQDPKILEELARDQARLILEEDGMGLAALVEALAARAAPYVQVAREQDWPEQDSLVPVLATEVEGEITLSGGGGPRPLKFRADRADLTSQGLLLTDYKVGRTISKAVKKETRRKNFMEGVAAGQRLQAVAYACLAEGRPGAVGRYLFLGPELDKEHRVFEVSSTEEDFLREFEKVAGVLLNAWDLGIFFPRLVSPDGKREPDKCHYCELAMACVRGDSGARARLLKWAKGTPGDPSHVELQGSFRDLWGLAEKKGPNSQDEEQA